MQGLLGDEEGEREYQKRLANVNAQNAANTRIQNELLNAFQGSPFETLLNPTASVSGVAQSRTLSATNPTERSVFDLLREYKTTQYIDTKTIPTTATQSGYNDNGNLYAYSGNKSASTTKSNDSGPDGSWKKTGFWPWQRTYQVAPPKWESYYWNNSFYQSRTNCYAYALNIRMNPITNKDFVVFILLGQSKRRTVFDNEAHCLLLFNFISDYPRVVGVCAAGADSGYVCNTAR